MSFIIAAPLPALQAYIVLPNPQFADTEGQPVTVNFKRSMNGANKTYVKSNSRRSLTWQFKMTRAKAEEFRRYLKSYFRAKLQVTDHKDVTWTGYLTNDPFEFSAEARAGGWPGREEVVIAIEFQGEKVS